MTQELLIDLYAAGELPEELEMWLEREALGDPSLAAEMQTLKSVVNELRAVKAPVMTDESYLRIYARLLQAGMGERVNRPFSTPSYMQYHLPMLG